MKGVSGSLVAAAVGALLVTGIARAAVLPTGSISINAGAATTGSANVNLTLSATDNAATGSLSMRFRNTDAEPYGPWEPYQTSRSWTLTGGPGTRKVYVQYMDGAGSISDANPAAAGAQGYMDSIVFADKTPPTGSILINNGAASTGTTEVVLNLTAADPGGSGVVSMRFRSSDAEAYGGWEIYQTPKAWTLVGGPGTRKVFVQFMDGAGNISDANPNSAGSQGYMDSILYADTTPPTGSIKINGGAASTGTTEVTLNLTAADPGGTGVVSMRFRNSDAEPYGAWVAYQDAVPWTLAPLPGTRKVSVQFTDGAGNVSDANPAVAGAQGYADTIVFTDATAPAGSILVNGGAATTDSVEVTLTLAAEDPGGTGVVSMRFHNEADPFGAWEPFAGTKAWTLAAGDGPKQVFAQLLDGAGNVSDADPVEPGAQGYAASITLQGEWTLPGDLSNCPACHGNPPHVGKDGLAGTADDAPNVMTYWSGSVRRQQDGGHGDPDGSAAVPCADCHDISLPAAPSAAKHGNGIYNSVWNNATASANTAHLKADFFTKFPANGAGDWGIQVAFDNYCTYECHDINQNGSFDGADKAIQMRHSRDVSPGGVNLWSVEFGTHLSGPPWPPPSPQFGSADSVVPVPIDADLNTDAVGGKEYAPCVSCHGPHGTGTGKAANNRSNFMLRISFPPSSNELCAMCHI